MSLTDLLQFLAAARKSGTLKFDQGKITKQIYFKDGVIVGSKSNDPREYLGQFLMSHGFITEPELMKAMEVQHQSGILLGKILVMINAISETDLLRRRLGTLERTVHDRPAARLRAG